MSVMGLHTSPHAPPPLACALPPCRRFREARTSCRSWVRCSSRRRRKSPRSCARRLTRSSTGTLTRWVLSRRGWAAWCGPGERHTRGCGAGEGEQPGVDLESATPEGVEQERVGSLVWTRRAPHPRVWSRRGWAAWCGPGERHTRGCAPKQPPKYAHTSPLPPPTHTHKQRHPHAQACSAMD
eukprot:366287-Chlamydomonas_euryale.AAC.1